MAMTRIIRLAGAFAMTAALLLPGISLPANAQMAADVTFAGRKTVSNNADVSIQ
ncbi:MAG: hypothetical protein WBO55_05300 [Rhizobiaceae bacterium]